MRYEAMTYDTKKNTKADVPLDYTDQSLIFTKTLNKTLSNQKV